MQTVTGKCHCGAVEFEVDFENGFDGIPVRRCNCSLCRRKGAVMSSVDRRYLRVTKGEENLSLYQWNTRIAEHYFCRTCGIYTHHARRSAPNEFGFNLACIEEFDPFSLENVEVFDGAALSLEQ